MKPSSEPSVRAYVRLIRSAEALHTIISRGLAPDGLSASQFSAMKVLRIHGKLAQRDIAKYILKSGGNITVLVDNLEKEGLVVRDRSTIDRRITYVSLTHKGEQIFDELYPSHLARIREAMSPLSEDECSILVDLLQKVCCEQTEIACTAAEPIVSSRA
jgi:MarR family 2-MHQ and catechol resistance regulon transcriptional repressor